jgi:hypothetical protein
LINVSSVGSFAHTHSVFQYCLYLTVTNQHGGRKDNTIILTNGQLAISTTTGEAHGWQHHIGEKLA